MLDYGITCQGLQMIVNPDKQFGRKLPKLPSRREEYVGKRKN
jgi:hypothetical protein